MSYLHGYDHSLDDAGVLRLVMNEYDRAKLKHGDYTLDGVKSNDVLRLAALVEEVGEVATELTYDHSQLPEGGTRAEVEVLQAELKARLKKELIQVANVALTWASIL